MGWKGTLRTVSAAANRMEQDAQRRHKVAANSQIAADAADDVKKWEDHIENLQSIHTDLTDQVAWETLLTKPAPRQAEFRPKHLVKAQAELSAFKPRMFDFLRGGSTKLQKTLEKEVTQAKLLDENERLALEEKHKGDFEE